MIHFFFHFTGIKEKTYIWLSLGVKENISCKRRSSLDILTIIFNYKHDP